MNNRREKKMTVKEYKDKYNILKMEFEKKEKLLCIEYATSNDPYNIGDIFEDHIGKIKIESKKVSLHGSYYSSPASMKYYGANLNKNGTINKRYPKRWAYQVNDASKK